MEQLRQVGKLLAKMTGVVDEGADGLGIRYLGGLLRFRRELGWRPTLGRCRFRLRPRLGLDAAGLGDGFVFRRLGLVDGLRRPVRGLVRIVRGEDIGSGVFEKGLMDERRDVRAGFLAIQGGAVAMGGLEGDELHHPLAFEHQGAVFFPARGGDGRVLQVDEVVGQVAGPAVAGGGFADELAEHLDGRLAGLVGVEAAQAEAVVGLEQGGDVDARVVFVDLFVEAVGDEVAVAGGNGETTQQGRIQFRLLGSFHTDGSKKHKPWRSRWCLEGVTGEGTGSYGRGNLDESYCLVRKILKILLRTVPSAPRRLVRSYGSGALQRSAIRTTMASATKSALRSRVCRWFMTTS